VIATLGVALDARMSTRTRDPHALARATRWIAANLLAVRRQRPLHLVRVETLTDLLAAIAVAPVLVDRDSLPAHWQIALRLVGIPFVDEAGGAPRLSLAQLPGGSYRVHVREPHMLAA
jgi:hypothetical protein